MKKMPLPNLLLAFFAILLGVMLVWSVAVIRQDLAWRSRLEQQAALRQRFIQLEQTQAHLIAQAGFRAPEPGEDTAIRARLQAWPDAAVQYRDPVTVADLVRIQAEITFPERDFPASLDRLADLQDLPVWITSIELRAGNHQKPGGSVAVGLTWFADH